MSRERFLRILLIWIWVGLRLSGRGLRMRLFLLIDSLSMYLSWSLV